MSTNGQCEAFTRLVAGWPIPLTGQIQWRAKELTVDVSTSLCSRETRDAPRIIMDPKHYASSSTLLSYSKSNQSPIARTRPQSGWCPRTK